MRTWQLQKKGKNMPLNLKTLLNLLQLVRGNKCAALIKKLRGILIAPIKNLNTCIHCALNMLYSEVELLAACGAS